MCNPITNRDSYPNEVVLILSLTNRNSQTSFARKMVAFSLMTLLLTWGVTTVDFAFAAKGGNGGGNSGNGNGGGNSGNGNGGGNSGNGNGGGNSGNGNGGGNSGSGSDSDSSGSDSDSSGSDSDSSGSVSSEPTKEELREQAKLERIVEKIAKTEAKLTEATDPQEIAEIEAKLAKLTVEKEIAELDINESYSDKELRDLRKIMIAEWSTEYKDSSAYHSLDRNFKYLTTSEEPEVVAESLGLDYEDGQTTVVLELEEIDEEVIAEIEEFGDIEVQSDNVIQISADIEDIEDLDKIKGVKKTRPPAKLSTIYSDENEGVESPYTSTGLVKNDRGEKDNTSSSGGNDKDQINNSGGIIGDKDQINNSGGIIGDKDQINNSGGIIGDKDQINNSGGLGQERYSFESELENMVSELSEEEQIVVFEQLEKYGKVLQLDDEVDPTQITISSVEEFAELVDYPESEGVYSLGADIVHEQGITGDGIKVAVLDLAFDTSNPKIVDSISDYKSFSGANSGTFLQQDESNGRTTAHGTAVAEIIADVAPDVDLLLYEMNTDVEFAAAIDEAIQNDADVIAMAAGWPNFPTDGTSHITKK